MRIADAKGLGEWPPRMRSARRLGRAVRAGMPPGQARLPWRAGSGPDGESVLCGRASLSRTTFPSSATSSCSSGSPVSAGTRRRTGRARSSSPNRRRDPSGGYAPASATRRRSASPATTGHRRSQRQPHRDAAPRRPPRRQRRNLLATTDQRECRDPACQPDETRLPPRRRGPYVRQLHLRGAQHRTRTRNVRRAGRPTGHHRLAAVHIWTVNVHERPQPFSPFAPGWVTRQRQITGIRSTSPASNLPRASSL